MVGENTSMEIRIGMMDNLSMILNKEMVNITGKNMIKYIQDHSIMIKS